MTHAALKDHEARIESVRVLTEMRDLGTPPCNFAHSAEELAALDAAIAALSAMDGEAHVEDMVESTDRVTITAPPPQQED